MHRRTPFGPLAVFVAAAALGPLSSDASWAKDAKKKPAKATQTTSTVTSPKGSSPASASGARKRPHKAAPTNRRGRKSESRPRPGAAAARTGLGATLRTWGDHMVAEGDLPPPIDGAACPPDMANVEQRFCVDRYEGSLVEIAPDGSEVPWAPYGAIEEGHALRAVSAPNVFPQGYISAAQAQRACDLAGKRLCSPVEWRKACTGPKAQLFGYGAEREAGRCNDHGKSPMLEYYPQVNVSWTLVGMIEMNDPRLNQMAGTIAPTGSHESCTNGYGVYDMVGNLHEWTSDPNGTFQGGYYLDTHLNGDGCSYRTTAHEFTYHDYSTGFRCCADPAVP